MKKIVAAALAAAICAPLPSFAQESEGGHYVWQTRKLPGPNKSNRVSRMRVWVKGAKVAETHRDCDAIQADASNCPNEVAAQNKLSRKG